METFKVVLFADIKQFSVLYPTTAAERGIILFTTNLSLEYKTGVAACHPSTLQNHHFAHRTT